MTSELGDNSLPNIIANLLEQGHTLNALTLFTDNKNSDEVLNNSWDLVPVVAHYLTQECESSEIEVFKCCQKLMDILAEQSKPEEVLLQFIEEIETAKDDVKFLTLLKPLEKVLLRVPDKRITSLAWCFNAVTSYLDKIETPEDLGYVGEERLLLDSNDIVTRITYVYGELLPFCDTFVVELTNMSDTSSVPERRQILRKFLIDLCGKPLAYLDMDEYKNTKPKARIIAEKLVESFFYFSCDPFCYLEIESGSDGSDLIKPNDVSLGVMYYLILYKEICVKSVPKVYSPVYLLHNCLPLVNKLLTQEGEFVVEKGVHLAWALLRSVDHLELSYLLLDSKHHGTFCKILSSVVVHNQSQDIRRKCLQILQTYMWSFEHQGRYLVILNLMRHVRHSGLKGNIITQYKEMLTRELPNKQHLSEFYSGRKFFDLLEEFTRLEQKEETDLVDESDRIVSTLNLLRFVLLADKRGDTCIDWYVDVLEEGYFWEVKTGIEMSKEHYRLKIKEVAEGGGEDKCAMSVTVSGRSLVEMGPESKIEILNLSLTTLDVIDSLLSRVKECIIDRRTM
jgi:hypothetical protein